jgi:16S rRNA (cytosine967-C5)-methyltransferase
MKTNPSKKPPSVVSPARREAFAILMELERSASVYADDLLRGARVDALSTQDRNLCTTLVLGTLRWQIRLDAAIRTRLAKPNAKLDVAVQIALRLGLFQLWYLDRIPAHAAIGESVSLARLAGHQHGSRMVNAVLRALSREPKPELSGDLGVASALAEATAHPAWMVERWVVHFGVETARAICLNGQSQPELDLRIESPEVEAELAGQGIVLAPGAILNLSRRLVSGDVTSTEAFKSGHVRIQEEGSQLIAELSSDVKQRPQRILDCCAAPGGKTLILAERNPEARVTAMEISPARYEALRERMAASRFARQIEVAQADATKLDAVPMAESDRYDLILVDVPCSGTGTMGRNPEIRHRLRPEDLARHHERQVAILRSALSVGSRRLIYSTCSLEPEENQAVVAELLDQATDQAREWRQISIATLLSEVRDEGYLTVQSDETIAKAVAADGSLTILPGSLGADVQTDGFFVAILERRV